MTYRVEFHAAALAQLKGLPAEAFDALVARAVQLVDAPWDAHALDSGELEFRQTTFGRFGILSFHVDEHRELLLIFDVTRAG